MWAPDPLLWHARPGVPRRCAARALGAMCAALECNAAPPPAGEDGAADLSRWLDAVYTGPPERPRDLREHVTLRELCLALLQHPVLQARASEWTRATAADFFAAPPSPPPEPEEEDGLEDSRYGF